VDTGDKNDGYNPSPVRFYGRPPRGENAGDGAMDGSASLSFVASHPPTVY
jgi:hypothetical protein